MQLASACLLSDVWFSQRQRAVLSQTSGWGRSSSGSLTLAETPTVADRTLYIPVLSENEGMFHCESAARTTKRDWLCSHKLPGALLIEPVEL